MRSKMTFKFITKYQWANELKYAFLKALPLPDADYRTIPFHVFQECCLLTPTAFMQKPINNIRTPGEMLNPLNTSTVNRERNFRNMSLYVRCMQ